jgi:hypothetical protein
MSLCKFGSGSWVFLTVLLALVRGEVRVFATGGVALLHGLIEFVKCLGLYLRDALATRLSARPAPASNAGGLMLQGNPNSVVPSSY